MTLTPGEAARKSLHIGMAGFALLLPSLSWGAALAAAGFAALFNALVLPRAMPYFLRREEGEKGFSLGIVLYPLTVFLLLVLFRRNLPVAAAGWGYLAFGDGFASICGMTLGGPTLPWNRRKSFSGLLGYVVFGFLGASFLFGFLSSRVPSSFELICLFAGALAGAAVESLPSELDDNVLPPLVGAAVLASLLATVASWADVFGPGALRGALVALSINVVVSGIALSLRLVRPSGALLGAALGTVILAFGTAPLYLLLWIFFGVGTLATRFRKARKEAIGRAEEKGGRRGAANVLANVTVAAFCALVAGLSPGGGGDVYRLAAAAALATALMDTVGTEIGQAIASPTVLLPDFRRVPPGTDGAVSVAGTLAGFAAAALLAGAAVASLFLTPLGAVAVILAACAGTVFESLLGRDGAPWRLSNGHVLNFLNTLVGAISAPAFLAAAGAVS